MAVSWLTQVDILTAFSLLGFILVLIPLYWHFEAWNVGCVLYIFWIGGQCFIQFVNLLIWRESVRNIAPVWCDITTRFYIAASLGVSCASLVINRRLYCIASVNTVSIRREEKRRNILIDLAIGLGIPIIGVALYWFYQGHRYNIFEGVGCIEEYPNTFLAYLLHLTWPIPIGLVSVTYCILTFRAFVLRRTEFRSLVRDSNANLSFGRYFRLMGLAVLSAVVTMPLAVWIVVTNLRAEGMYRWRGLGNLHSGFGRVDTYPLGAWIGSERLVQVFQFRLWMPVAYALWFFAFFGMAEEARRHYRTALTSVARRIGIRVRERSQPGDTLPSFVSPQKSAEELVSGTVGSLSSQSSTQTIQANMQDESEKELGENSTAQISDESIPGTTVSGQVKAPAKAWIE